jgi:hypothetical protein
MPVLQPPREKPSLWPVRILRRSPCLHRYITRSLALALLAAAVTLAASAQSLKPSQTDVQAIYLYNFAKFVRWPSPTTGAPGTPIDICIAGQKVYVDALSKAVAGEQIDARPLAVRSIERPEDEAGCDILFVGVSVKDRLDTLLAPTAGKPIVTVSDIPGFLDHGGMIQFLLIDNRVRFSINLDPVNRSQLAVSSELLKVAVTVNGKPGGGTR